MPLLEGNMTKFKIAKELKITKQEKNFNMDNPTSIAKFISRWSCGLILNAHIRRKKVLEDHEIGFWRNKIMTSSNDRIFIFYMRDWYNVFSSDQTKFLEFADKLFNDIDKELGIT